jgi:ADP-ribose pyrophosphatase
VLAYQASRTRSQAFRRSLLDYIVLMPKAKRSKGKARIISSRTVFKGPVFTVTSDDVLEPTGVRARRDVVHHPGSVVVLAVENRQGEPHILLERQYRHAAKTFLWELPAGRIDEGEKSVQAAKRELLEETGYSAAHWKLILDFYASPGFLDETMLVYLATDLRSGKAQPEDDEVIRKRFFSLQAALRLVTRRAIKDAKTIASVLWLAHQSL